MKVAIDYQNVDLSKEENDYYQELIKQLTTDSGTDGKEYFRDLFVTDEQGFITIIKPKNSIPWIVLFFIQQVMINQRLRTIDDFMARQEKK